MPIDTDAIDEAINNAAAEGVASYTSDGETVSSFNPKDLIELHKYASGLAATQSGRTGWNAIGRQRAAPGGTGPT